MASTFVNDLRLNEMATGDQSGSWGTVTNTNLELIGDAFGFGTEAITTNNNTHETLIANGAADAGRSMFLRYTGTLDSPCTITISAGASATDFTISKLWFIENATTGGENIIITSGSGADVTIPAGDVKVIYTNGAGSGGAVVDAFASLSVVDLNVSGNLDVDGTANLDAVDIDGAVQIDATLSVGVNDTGYDVKFFGATAAAFMLWDQSEDDLILGGAAGLSVNSAALVTGVLTTTAATVFNGGFAAGGVGTFANGSSTAPSITNTGDTNTGMYFPADDTIQFTTGGTAALKINSDGNVVYLDGSFQIQSDAQDAAIFIAGGNNSNDGGNIAMFGPSHTTVALRNVTRFRQDQVESMRIDTDGHLLLGSSGNFSANGTLVVQQTADSKGIAIIDSAAANTLFLENDGTINKIRNNAAVPIAFETSSAERMRITAAGFVGIRTTAPAAPLQVDTDNGFPALVLSRDGGVSGRRPFGVAIGGNNDASMFINASNDTTGAGAFGSSRVVLMELEAAGDVTVKTGNLKIGTAGKGINFSATSDGAGTDTSEILNDYEEGTFSPVMTVNDSASGMAQSTNVGRYIKVGRHVTCWLQLTLSNKGSASGHVRIQGFPYAASNLDQTDEAAAAVCSFWNNLASAATPGGYMQKGTSKLLLINNAASTASPSLGHGVLNNNSGFYYQVCYNTVAVS